MALFDPAKTLIPKNTEYCIKFFCTFLQTKTILICIQSLILSTDRPKQTIALYLEKKTTDILFPLFIFQSTYSSLFKIKLSFNEQRRLIALFWFTKNQNVCIHKRKVITMMRWWKTVTNGLDLMVMKWLGTFHGKKCILLLYIFWDDHRDEKNLVCTRRWNIGHD